MDAGERAAMLDLFETILREDEYRRILGINSYEQDLGPDIERIEARVGRERESRPRWARLLHLLARRDFTLAEKWEHHLRMRRRRRVKEDLRTRPELCLRPWFGMTVRSDGAVPVCCARQDRLIADAGATPLPAIWRSEPFVAFRAQMRALWNGAAVPERGWVSPRCAPGAQGVERCPFRSHYYREDRRFFERLHAIARRPSAA
jgi:hypothetical protein